MVKVSVLIPVFNEESRLGNCIDSILQSQVSFRYEILICDDCSTDRTLAVAMEYRDKNPNIIQVLRNENNLGNGKTFYKLLTKARGEYFHVLDADDLWISKDKLQFQVDFLDQNKAYSMAANNTERRDSAGGLSSLYLTKEGSSRMLSRELDAKVILTGKAYFHTSSILFRNIYRGNVPKIFADDRGGGDVIRMRVHSIHGKIKYFDQVWSVYNYDGSGIWSSLERTEQLRRVKNSAWFWFKITPYGMKRYSWVFFCNAVYKYRSQIALESGRLGSVFLAKMSKKNYQVSNFVVWKLERRLRKIGERFRFFWSRKSAIFEKMPLNRKLLDLQLYLKNGEFLQAAKVFDQLVNYIAYPKYFRSKIFSGPVPAKELAEAAYQIGRGIVRELPGEKQYYIPSGSLRSDSNNSQNWVILTSGISARGGGTMDEMKNVISALPSQDTVHIVCAQVTCQSAREEIESQFIELRSDLRFHYSHFSGISDKIIQLYLILKHIKPEFIFLYHSHHDLAVLAALQGDVVQTVFLANHLDHGLNPGVGHPMIAGYLCKRHWEANYFHKYLDIPVNKIYLVEPFLADALVPPKANWNELLERRKIQLRSAVVVARSYKVMDPYIYQYHDLIAKILSRFPEMVHHHIGPLRKADLNKIHRALRRYGVSFERFIHIPWFDMQQGLAKELGVNLFFQSWPIGSGRAAMKAMAEGLPVIQHLHSKSSQFVTKDFLYTESKCWRTPDDLFDVLDSLDVEWILEQSEASYRYFKEHHSEIVGRSRFSKDGLSFIAIDFVEMTPFKNINLRNITRSLSFNLAYLFAKWQKQFKRKISRAHENF